MLKAIKTRIYPTQEQIQLIEKSFGCNRFIFNWGLEQQIQAHKDNQKFIHKYKLMSFIPKLKQKNEWLKEVDSSSLQNTLENLDSAYKKFFKEKKGFPKFKSKKKDNRYTSKSCLKIKTRHYIQFPKLKLIKTKEKLDKRIIPKKITISKQANKYFAAILYKNDLEFPIKRKIKKQIGIDLGIKDFAIFSNGDIIKNPKILKNKEKNLKKLQKRLSKKTKSGQNRKRAKYKVANQYLKISNSRKDFLHKLSTTITKSYDYIAIENLAIKNMVKNHKLAKAISDCGWGEFVRQLEYKSNWYGSTLIKIGRFEPSSQICFNCGWRNKTLTLSDRKWTCLNCKTVLNRDINAAKNILKFSYSPTDCRGEPGELFAVAKALNQENL